MNKKVWATILSVFLVVAAISGCATKTASAPVKQAERSFAPAQPPQAPAPAATPGVRGAADTASAQESVAERMIIQNVNMSVIVEDTDKAVADLQALLKQHKGYVADSRRWYDNDQPYAHMTLRVPAESLEQVMSQIRSMVIKVENESLSGQDVTDQYTDNAARLRNLEATEKELLALLTEVRENRGKADEILAIHRELTNIRGQIEVLKGRQQYLERMTALATIQMEIRPKKAPKPLVEKESWNPLITINNALRAFVAFVRVLVDVAIYLIIFGWPVVLLGIIIWALARRAQRRKAAKTSEPNAKKQ